MMGRYLPAFVLLGAGSFVLWHNANMDSVLALPFIDTLWPATKGDYPQQGHITGVAFLVIGGLMLFRAIYATMTRPPQV